MQQRILMGAAVLFGELLGAFVELGGHVVGFISRHTELLQGTGQSRFCLLYTSPSPRDS